MPSRPASSPRTRARWLSLALAGIRRRALLAGAALPVPLRLYVTSLQRPALGLWVAPPDSPPSILLSGRLRSPTSVLAVLLHELAHAALAHGRHDGQFHSLLRSWGVDERREVDGRIPRPQGWDTLLARLGPWPRS